MSCHLRMHLVPASHMLLLARLWLSDNHEFEPPYQHNFHDQQTILRLNPLFYPQELVQFTELTDMKAKSVNY